ncbi:carbamoyl-phosphate synthase large subunit [Arenicella sp. 4NH20-0111]|uniref:carbamoyl-phosphate synthase large subunit n=1 Tax=Arenicella sp. 4NH20-0111 TaxID=3127648 RepID=UPI0031048BE6
MPKRNDIQTVLIIGAGPIIIGQACEFDYSGVQACKALKEEGYRVVLVNSNPATIMTDPGFADATYIEPISWQSVEKIIETERPDVLLPTMGGQTALNCALDLEREGVLAKYDVEMIGATKEAIDKAEDRDKFKTAMEKIGLEIARGDIAHSMEQSFEILEDLGLPVIIRPSFTMGGTGGGIAYNKEEFVEICERGLEASPTNELLIEECIFGWKEYEMEVVRDREDNCIIICSIENFDAMGVHTGDSITVAPAQTLTDKEYQIMRDASLAVLREIGVDTGGSNVQFAVDPKTGRMIIIEMNPRVSRSSALASKATGFPIAKVAAKLAVGYTLDELRNEITGGLTPASFEPSIDYVVTKIPRFDFVKFPQADSTLTTQMKSVGEAMAIGRTFQESLQKAMRSLEIGSHGFEPQLTDLEGAAREQRLSEALRVPKADRLWYIGQAFREGLSVKDVHEATGIEPWFLAEIEDLIAVESMVGKSSLASLQSDQVFAWKRKGFSDVRLSELLNVSEDEFRAKRHQLEIRPVYKRVDSCAAEFSTATAYMYSTYEEECESEPNDTKKIMVLGGGPNRIGQGIEFDYCCVHASMALREDGYQTIMVNCNPETVSTDYDTSDRLYFEPLTLEDVLEIVHKEDPTGVIVQYGGQTPLKLARPLKAQGTRIIGTSPKAIHDAEDREEFQALLNRLQLKQPPNRIASSEETALELAEEVGYPLVVRPSYVLGGRAMEIVHDSAGLKNYMHSAIQVSNESPVLLDRFLNDAIEVDVDAICDGSRVVIGGIMEHIEEAGVHSGDSACSLPPFSLTEEIKVKLREQTTQMALALNVVGLMNVQFAIKGETIYVLEVNPRASRTVPFVSKATSRPLAKVAALCMAGKTLDEQGIGDEIIPDYYSVKEAVFPFVKFPGVDTLLTPEMKSTGEVMGVGRTFGEAYDKAQQGAGSNIPKTGTALFSVRNSDKEVAVELAKYLSSAGFDIVATRGTAATFESAGIPVQAVNKVAEGRPHIVDLIIDDKADLVINTTSTTGSVRDSYTIRREALMRKVTYYTNISSARAMVAAHKALCEMRVSKLQDLHQSIK